MKGLECRQFDNFYCSDTQCKIYLLEHRATGVHGNSTRSVIYPSISPDLSKYTVSTGSALLYRGIAYAS